MGIKVPCARNVSRKITKSVTATKTAIKICRIEYERSKATRFTLHTHSHYMMIETNIQSSSLSLSREGSNPDESSSTRRRLLSIHNDSTTFLKQTIDFFHNSEAPDDAAAAWCDDEGKAMDQDAGNHNHATAISCVNSSASSVMALRQPSPQLQLRWPVVANERCGSWYAHPHTTTTSVHFKSTDGHKHIYNFSLKRLNLPFLKTIADASRNRGAVLLVDASKYKMQPDSFSATLPIWCAVMNRVILYYKRRLGLFLGTVTDKDGEEDWLGSNVDSDSGRDTLLFTPTCISQEHIDEMS